MPCLSGSVNDCAHKYPLYTVPDQTRSDFPAPVSELPSPVISIRGLKAVKCKHSGHVPLLRIDDTWDAEDVMSFLIFCEQQMMVLIKSMLQEGISAHLTICLL